MQYYDLSSVHPAPAPAEIVSWVYALTLTLSARQECELSSGDGLVDRDRVKCTREAEAGRGVASPALHEERKEGDHPRRSASLPSLPRYTYSELECQGWQASRPASPTAVPFVGAKHISDSAQYGPLVLLFFAYSDLMHLSDTTLLLLSVRPSNCMVLFVPAYSYGKGVSIFHLSPFLTI